MYLMDMPKNAVSLLDRTPFGFDHTLGDTDLFDFKTICALARKYDHDYNVAPSATTPGARDPLRSIIDSPYEALQHLDVQRHRVLLKRPEQYDTRYCDLMLALFEQILQQRGGLEGKRVVRLASSILVSSAATTTPFHFDPEMTFFFQIEGEKSYHLYPPAVLSEPELERFYKAGMVYSGPVALDGRDAAREIVFELTAGKGMHQPQNAPHWVRTQASRSISYAISFETEASRTLGRTRAFNYYQRKLGLPPAPPGANVKRDAIKARAMEVAIPLRKYVAALIRKPSALGAARERT